jgi:RND family efflux transporter MFP subunit
MPPPLSRPALGCSLLLLAAVLAGGCEKAGSTAPAGAQPRPAEPRAVKLVPAQEVATDRRVTATGTLAADEQVVLGTKVAGRVAELPVDLGTRVRRGQPVAKLDPVDARLRVEQAVAALQQARARLGLSPEGTDDRVEPEQTALVRQARAVLDEAALTRERAERLAQQQLIAHAQVDAAVAALEVARGRHQDALEEVRSRQGMLLQRRSELELARQQLLDTVVVSPIDGGVSDRKASVGEFLAAGAPVVTLVKTHPLRLRLAVPERESGGVRIGQTVLVTVEGASGEHRGRVARLSPAITEQTRSLAVEAEVPNETGVLRPGAFAKVDIVVASEARMITVPASALVVFAGVEKVLTVDKGKAVEVRVQTGRRQGERVEIVSGLAAGTGVVAQPGNLTHGQPVAVQP